MLVFVWLAHQVVWYLLHSVLLDDLRVPFVYHELLYSVVQLLSLVAVFQFTEDFWEGSFLNSVYLLFLIVNTRFHRHRQGALWNLSVDGHIVGCPQELLKLSHLLWALALIFYELIVYLLYIHNAHGIRIWVQGQGLKFIWRSYQADLLLMSDLLLRFVLQALVRNYVLVIRLFTFLGLLTVRQLLLKPGRLPLGPRFLL